jgi:putative hemolysin
MLPRDTVRMKKEPSVMNKTSPDTANRRFVAQLATSESDILESLQLRYRVFAEELGAKLQTGAARIDMDRFDRHCSHLIVRDMLTRRIVASTRLLSEAGAAAAGGFYSESEFDLAFLGGLTGRKLEVGRTCVDPAFRSGAVIATLWSRLVEHVMAERYDYLFGCASISLEDGGQYAQSVMTYLSSQYQTDPDKRVRSRHCLPAADLRDASSKPPRLPPLLKAYVGLGAKVCGEGYWDQDFNCVDVFVMLEIANMAPRFVRHFATAHASVPSRMTQAA